MTAARERMVRVVAEALIDSGVTTNPSVLAEAVVAALEAQMGLRVERQDVRLPQFEGDVRPGPRPNRLVTDWQEGEG